MLFFSLFPRKPKRYINPVEINTYEEHAAKTPVSIGRNKKSFDIVFYLNRVNALLIKRSLIRLKCEKNRR